MSEKITYQEHGDTKTEYIDKYGDKMKIYEYNVDEWSEDTRKFVIKSDRKLTSDEVCDIYQDASFDDEGKTVEYSKGITLLYRGTDYGSSDYNITGDELVDD